MRTACGPVGPFSISNVTRWFSRKDLKPAPVICEKCANKSLPESSGVMNPKPLSSLNHFTVPVAIFSPSGLCALRNAEGAEATTAETRGTPLSGRLPDPSEQPSDTFGYLAQPLVNAIFGSPAC